MADARQVYRDHPTDDEIADILRQRLTARVGTINEAGAIPRVRLAAGLTRSIRHHAAVGPSPVLTHRERRMAQRVPAIPSRFR